METATQEVDMERYDINFVNQHGDLQTFESVRGFAAAHESRLRLRALVGPNTRISIKEIRP